MFHRPVPALPSSSLSLLVVSSLAVLLLGCGGGSSGGTAAGNSTGIAVVPVVTSVAPLTVSAGSAAFTLQINGSGFVSGSVASWNGTNLMTTYVSPTMLDADVPASLVTGGGTFTIAVADPNGQSSSGSSSASIVVDNPAPTIASISPASITAGSGGTSVVITGSGFEQSSAASFSGNARPTTVQSGTQLTMALTAADLAATGQESITVANPAPGGGVSAPITFTVTLPAPVINGVMPSPLIVDSPATPVTVNGTGFTAASKISADGIAQMPSSITATAISFTIPATDLAFANPIALVVQNGGLISNFFGLPVVNPVPVIQSLPTSTVTAGSPGFNLLMNATGVVSNTQVNVNGAPISTNNNGSLTNNGQISVPIAANLLAQVGTVSISLTNPAPGGGTSNTVTLNVIAANNFLRTVNLPANALVWNPQQQVIYAAVPAVSSTNANCIVAIDPASGNVLSVQQMPGQPTLLAISGDQQYLYVGMPATATIARLKLPSLAPDIQWSVAPDTSGLAEIFNLAVAPGLPHTIAVAQVDPSAINNALIGNELAIYDDGVLRPNTVEGTFDDPISVLAWGADASTIYGTENTVSTGPEFTFSISAQGAALVSTAAGALPDFPSQLVYDSSENRLYSPSGVVVDAATGESVGSFPVASASFAVDSAQRRVYFLTTTPYPDAVNSGLVPLIQVFDQDRFASEGTIALPSLSANLGNGGANLIRWGISGLAFGSGNNIYILDGPFVTPGALPSSSVGTYAMSPPQLSGLSPESVVAGSPDTTITLTGQNLTAATAVSWNNNVLATTFINNTEVQATIPAASLTTPATAPLYVSNGPGEGISNVLAFSVLPSLGTGMQFSALNLSGSDLAWNAANGLLYVAVPNGDSLRPESIATVDPAAGTILSALPAGANPYVLSISGDDQYLYAGFTDYANVQRYALPDLTPDLLIPLGIGQQQMAQGAITSCDFAVSMGVAPGLDSTIAVTQGNWQDSPRGCGATVVIDGATPRPVDTSVFQATGQDVSELTWGANPTALYGVGADDGITSLTVANSGVTVNQSALPQLYFGYRPHFDPGTGLIFTDEGLVVQPSNLTEIANFHASGLMVPDSTLGLAYFLGQTASQQGTTGQDFALQIYNLYTYALLDSIVIPNVIGSPSQMVRWGASGIAFTTESGDASGNNAPGLTYILSGPEIAKPTASLTQKFGGAERVRLTWKPRSYGQGSTASSGNPNK